MKNSLPRNRASSTEIILNGQHNGQGSHNTGPRAQWGSGAYRYNSESTLMLISIAFVRGE